MANKRKRPLAPAQAQAAPQGSIPVDKKAAYRSVRPRPLRYDEKIRILWPGDPSLELLDGGAFAKWLKETAEQPADASYVSSNTQGSMRIQVPNYRVLPKKDLPPQPTAAAHAAMPDSTEEAAYIRLRGQTQDEIETKIDYDLDSDDEQWLTKRKAKTSGDMLTKDDLERLIDGFEKAKHDVMERRQTEWRRQGPGRAVTPPDKLEPGLLYPVSSAIRDFGNSFPSLTVRAVHNYWAKKAGASKLPLLQRFWYDKPWGRLADLAKLTQQDSSSDEEDGIPFQGKDSPAREIHHHRKKMLDLSDVEDRLHLARIDLEKVRTIADQIRRREKVKKRMVMAWRTSWQQKIALTNRPATKGAKKQGAKKNAKLSKPVKLAKPLVLGKATKTAGKKALADTETTQKENPERPPASKDKQLKLSQSKAVKKQAAKQPAAPEQLPSAAAKKRAAATAASADQEQSKIAKEDHGKAAAHEKHVNFAPKALTEQPPKTTLKGSQQAAAKVSKAAAKQRAKGKEVTQEKAKRKDQAAKAERAGETLSSVPAGFSVSVKATPGKPRGYVEWLATCKHGDFKMDRMAKVAQLFEQHGKCRPDWKRFMRGAKEGAAEYEARLKQSFSFTQSDVSEEAGDISKAVGVQPSRPNKKGSTMSKELKALGAAVLAPTDQRKSNAHRGSAIVVNSKAAEARSSTRSRVAAVEGKGKGRIQAGTVGRKPKNKPVTRRHTAPKAASDSKAAPVARPPRQASQAILEPPSTTAAGHSREPSVEYFEAMENVTSSSSSSGSDTFVPADSDLYSSEEETSHPPATRFGSVRNSRGQRGLAKQATIGWSENDFAAERQHSDASSLSEGSWPSLFSQDQFLETRGKSSGPLKTQVPSKASKRTKTKGRNIVAAARQRARQATAR